MKSRNDGSGAGLRPGPHRWEPSKYRIDGNVVRGSRDTSQLACSSRIIADLVGEFYTSAIPRWVSGDLVDLGCGKAPLLAAYRGHCSSVVLADWGNSAHANPNLDLIIDLNEPLAVLGSSSFDVVLLSDVLEHIAEPGPLICEIQRILRPGGRLVLNVPFIYWIHEAPYDFYRYTRYALERFIREAGLEVIEVVPLGGWLEVMADLWAKILVRTKLSFVASGVHRAVIAFHGTEMGRRLALRGGEILPIGYGLVARKPMTA